MREERERVRRGDKGRDEKEREREVERWRQMEIRINTEKARQTGEREEEK
jgi:hypothetical protein